VDGDQRTDPSVDENHDADCKEDTNVMSPTDSPGQQELQDLSDVGNGSLSAVTTTNAEPEPLSISSSIDRDFFRQYSWETSTRL